MKHFDVITTDQWKAFLNKQHWTAAELVSQYNRFALTDEQITLAAEHNPKALLAFAHFGRMPFSVKMVSSFIEKMDYRMKESVELIQTMILSDHPFTSEQTLQIYNQREELEGGYLSDLMSNKNADIHPTVRDRIMAVGTPKEQKALLGNPCVNFTSQEVRVYAPKHQGHLILASNGHKLEIDEIKAIWHSDNPYYHLAAMKNSGMRDVIGSAIVLHLVGLQNTYVLRELALRMVDKLDPEIIKMLQRHTGIQSAQGENNHVDDNPVTAHRRPGGI